ncbi:MAG TPA: hypothetical protein VNN72_22995 [Polyangiaceae bacterium]|nr:hypothetical protein [Polyangiaceae bacterium]
MIREDDELDADALCALALFALTGAQIYSSDSTFLPRSFDSDQQLGIWVYLVAAMVPLATVAYLVVSGG